MNFGMSSLDWSVVFGLIILLFAVLIYCQKFVHSTSDFIAANRCAERYLLTITSGIANIGAISIIAMFEQIYASGFSNTWWSFIRGPLGLIISITGWVYYRLRETRCLTMAQFIEVRYSKKLRVFAGIMGWLSGVVNYGIFPCISVKFFMIYCRLPVTFQLPGCSYEFGTYAVFLFGVCALGAGFAICGGQIAIMMTDFLQGVFCNVAFLVLLIYLLRIFSWENIFQTLGDEAAAQPGTSLFNPFDTTSIEGFNINFFIIGLFFTVVHCGSWQGSAGYHAAAKNAHEAKMSRFLGTWRGLIQESLVLFIPICAFTFFHHPQFAEQAVVVEDAIAQLSIRDAVQQRVPMFLNYVLPTGLVGTFAAVMFAAMLSTDDTYMHSWGTIFIQDVILPFRKKPFTPKQHLWALRGSILFVAVFAYIFSYLFKQTEYIMMFMQITGAIFMGGACAVIIGGLYSKVGTTLGGWVSMVSGSSLALGSILLQQFWTKLTPWLGEILGGNAKIWLNDHAAAFPLNGQVIAFWVTVIAFSSYFLVSWLNRKFSRLPEFNLNQMLHRGEYDTAQEHQKKWSTGKFWRLLGLTNEFSLFDRILFFACLTWTAIWCGNFIFMTIGHFSQAWEPIHWLKMWRFYVMLGFYLGIGTTIWFLVCGLLDVRKLFRSLGKAERNYEDDGRVVNGKNTGE